MRFNPSNHSFLLRLRLCVTTYDESRNWDFGFLACVDSRVVLLLHFLQPLSIALRSGLSKTVLQGTDMYPYQTGDSTAVWAAKASALLSRMATPFSWPPLHEPRLSVATHC